MMTQKRSGEMTPIAQTRFRNRVPLEEGLRKFAKAPSRDRLLPTVVRRTASAHHLELAAAWLTPLSIFGSLYVHPRRQSPLRRCDRKPANRSTCVKRID